MEMQTEMQAEFYVHWLKKSLEIYHKCVFSITTSHKDKIFKMTSKGIIKIEDHNPCSQIE